MKIVGVAGFKNAGKTTLVVELIKELRQRGVRVATIKHAHHDFDIDHPGKDSYQHRAAGAEEVIVASSRRWAQIRELGTEDEPPFDALLARLGEVDLVLVEGYKHGTHPKLELRRAGYDHSELANDDPAIVAIVADYAIADAPVPVLPRDNVPAIVDFVLQRG
ncbi:MAG: molybdopterin-guanine dinucleotide biosynthesis protein B [Gammaproteobacteria bacterium]|nr:molybdopterin-guanine dinucleotide biosynthesis protein B [Gammaproteobacteria bacterium]